MPTVFSSFNRQRYRPWLRRDRPDYRYDRYDSPTSSDTDTSLDYRAKGRSKYSRNLHGRYSKRSGGQGKHRGKRPKPLKRDDWKRFGAAAIRNTGLAICSVYPSVHQYIFFQDIYGQIRCMQWIQASRGAGKLPDPVPGPGTLPASVDRDSTGGVLEEAGNAKWGTPLAAVVQETKKPCCKGSNAKGQVLYLFYLNPENFVRGLSYTEGKWEPLLKLSQSLIHVHPNTKLSALSTVGQDGQYIHVYYQGLDQKIRELSMDSDKLNETIVSQEPPVSGSHIGVCTIANGSTIMVFYQNQKNSIHSCFKKSNRRWSPAAWKITNPLFFPQQPFTVVAEPNDFICTTKELRQAKQDPQSSKESKQDPLSVTELEQTKDQNEVQQDQSKGGNKAQGKTTTSQENKPQEPKRAQGTIDTTEPLYRVAVRSETVRIFFNYQLASNTKVPVVTETSFTLTHNMVLTTSATKASTNGFSCARKAKAHKGWPQSEPIPKATPPKGKGTSKATSEQTRTVNDPDPEANTYSVFPGASLTAVAWVTGDLPAESEASKARITCKRHVRVFIQRADCHFIHLETGEAMEGALIKHNRKLDVGELTKRVATLQVVDDSQGISRDTQQGGGTLSDSDDEDEDDYGFEEDSDYESRYGYKHEEYDYYDDDDEEEEEDDDDEEEDEEGGQRRAVDGDGEGGQEESEGDGENGGAGRPAGRGGHGGKEELGENNFYVGPLFLTVDEGAHDDDEEVFTKRPDFVRKERGAGNGSEKTET